MPADTDYPLFVYGLLRRGMSAGLEAFVGPGAANLLCEATLLGKLYDLGEYPGVLLDDGPSVVHGELWRVRDTGAWATLDDFEGIGPGFAEPTLYRRVLATAQPLLGEAQTCWVYVYNREVGEAPRIPSGDWADR